MLTDSDIEWQIKAGKLKISPFSSANLQPASVDLRLGTSIIYPKGGRIIDRSREWGVEDKAIPLGEGRNLIPDQFALVSTLEHVEIPGYLVGELVGKSTLARDGLMVECAGYVDPGWKGQLTLELKNIGPDIIVLRPGMLICQIRFHELSVISDRKPLRLYGDSGLNSHYQGSQGPRQGYRVEPDPE